MPIVNSVGKSELNSDYEPQFDRFHDLIKFRVREILLVSSYYDAFVLEEDGRLSERIFSEYVGLNLRFIPRIIRVSSAEEALKVLKKSSFDLVITMTRIMDMDPDEFGRQVKKKDPGLQVILLTYDWLPPEKLKYLRESEGIDKVFYWTGDTRILLAIIKFVEDRKNVDRDIKLGVRIILVIEDSPRFYSLFLPIIYTEIMTQTRMLISEGVNDLHRMLRMRARPKILLAETYEEGRKIYKRYKKSLLGIISDIRYPRKGEIDVNAGFRFGRKVKEDIPDIPFLLQSSNPENKEKAEEKGLDFLNKYSENLLEDLRIFILSNFGFGDFLFKDPDGNIIGSASNLQEFIRMLDLIPDEVLEYHAGRNHLSIWLRARTEFEIADKLRPLKVSDFSGVGEMRKFIKDELVKVIKKNRLGVITDFGASTVYTDTSFIRLGSGSLGGKARGVAFINSLLANTELSEKFPDVEIKTPYTFVICSEVYEEFMTLNNLQNYAIRQRDNEKIKKKFLAAKLPKSLKKDLRIFIENINYPVAVRSSSLLEDSQLLPFAGLYSTYMLSNNSKDIKIRFRQLCDAIKLIYASIFFKSPKEYVKNTNFRIEEEKMAVIIQQLVGQEYHGRFYPVISGVAQSYNFYPFSHMEAEDGIVQLAIGLGMTIVEGEHVYRFSPEYPDMNPPYSKVPDLIKNSQSIFYALDMREGDTKSFTDENFNLKKCDLNASEKDGTLFFVGSTYSGIDNAIRDTISIKGPRVVTFANVLKYGIFPLADIMNELLGIGRESFGSHIEIEFAVNLFRDKNRKPEFNLLQIRPMVTSVENLNIIPEEIHRDEALLSSTHPLGNGIFSDLKDIVFVDPEKFETSSTRKIAKEIEIINSEISAKERRYILIGFGRWGTADPWLGIPVDWHQMSGAKVIIESNLEKFKVEPSQGSHFFHNLISLQMGYMHLKDQKGGNFIDWEWLRDQKKRKSNFKYISHIALDKPVLVKIDAKNSIGVIYKP